MTARDKFSAKLKCPECGREGTARFSEADGWAYAKGDKGTSIEDVPDGFVAVEARSWIGTVDVLCADHRVSALVKP